MIDLREIMEHDPGTTNLVRYRRSTGSTVQEWSDPSIV